MRATFARRSATCALIAAALARNSSERVSTVLSMIAMMILILPQNIDGVAKSHPQSFCKCLNIQPTRFAEDFCMPIRPVPDTPRTEGTRPTIL